MIGVSIERFQVDEIHEGHLQLLRLVQERRDRLVILLMAL